MYIVDAKGLVCPKPVIMAKKALKDNDEITVCVDNGTSKENLEKMAVVMNLECSTEIEGSVYKITLKKTGASAAGEKSGSDYVVVFNNDFMGFGSEELGKALVKSLIYTITEAESLPSAMLFYNGGIKLTTKGSGVLDDLKKLEEAGVEILSCGTCLNYFGLSDALEVGGVTNMYVIFEKQQKAGKIIRL